MLCWAGSGAVEPAISKGRGLLGAGRGVKQSTATAAVSMLFRGRESRVMELQGSSLDYSLLFQTAGVCPWKLPAPALPSAASEVGMTLAPHPRSKIKLREALGQLILEPLHFTVLYFLAFSHHSVLDPYGIAIYGLLWRTGVAVMLKEMCLNLLWQRKTKVSKGEGFLLVQNIKLKINHYKLKKGFPSPPC